MDGGKGNAMERNETDAGFFFKDWAKLRKPQLRSKAQLLNH
jgi:hypothetical protein